MKEISLCMIVKNEEKVLSRCLNSIKNIVDEIIIVDTGSTDNTIKIAKQYTDKIYNFDWCDDFAKARNFSFSKATKEYIMWLDADDVVPTKSRKKLLELKNRLSADVYMFKYDIAIINNQAQMSFFRERIIKNCQYAKWDGCVHECITPFGHIERINISIEHRKIKNNISTRNLNIYQKVYNTRKLTPRELYYFARELFDHKKYKKSITLFKKFLHTNLGWIENIIDAYYMISLSYFKLQHLNKAKTYLLQTLQYTEPRANICCLLADIFLSENKYILSKYWYHMALKCEDVSNKGAFVEPKYYNYYPYLQLCVIYYKLGNIDKSIYYNEKAGKYKQASNIVDYNRKIFNKLKLL